MGRQTPIMDALGAICANTRARFCMPGHKGDTGFFCGDVLALDITEVPGADNLLFPSGAILESERLHAQFIGARSVHYTTCGSTAGVFAMLSLFSGKKVIFPRGIHLSAANAVSLFGITPVMLDPVPGDYPQVANARDVKTALLKNKDAAAVFITYPNYFGFCCDIEEIARITHRHGIPLLVDAAHAAHFAYSSLLPLAPSQSGADVWTESAHKTLPAMTQCACVCVGADSLIESERVKRALTQFQTTSPSYPLLASLDYAHAYMRDKGEQELFRVINLVKRFEETVDSLPGFCCPEIACEGVIGRDRLKVIIDVSATGQTGISVRNALLKQGIYAEAADLKNILLMFSPGNTAAQFEMLLGALKKIEKVPGRGVYFSPYSMPPASRYVSTGRLDKYQKVKIELAAGCICASAAGVFPPSEAVLLRGQVITRETAQYISEAVRNGFEVFGIEGDSITVFRDKA